MSEKLFLSCVVIIVRIVESQHASFEMVTTFVVSIIVRQTRITLDTGHDALFNGPSCLFELQIQK